MKVLEGARLPIYTWADLEPGAAQQARNCADLEVAAHHVAVMADGHQGYGVPIGAVLALEGALSPFAVGNDIGCGMAAVPTAVSRDDLLAPVRTRSGGLGPPARDEIMGWVQSSIPSGRDTHTRPQADERVRSLLDDAFDALEAAAARSGVRLTTSQSPDADRGRDLTRDEFAQRGATQAGTLGAGNHFVELLADTRGRVWVLVHSGSRGVGGLICNNFHRMALERCAQDGVRLPDPGLAWLPLHGDERWAAVGRAYERALRAALEYAEANRHRMLEVVADIVERRFPEAMSWDDTINIHHNDATLEEHFGQPVWVHRKGAVKASVGTATITPGSMGSATYLGRGLGNRESFSSCSHGAGRAMSRGEAKRRLSLQEQLAVVGAAGGKVFAARKDAVLDEMPGAYKDLDEVMRAQADLVEVTERLTPIATYKGVETSRRRKGWRPEEER